MRGSWQPIESAPKDGTEILVYIRGVGRQSPFMQTVVWRDGYFWDMSDFGYREYVTHWMPLPEPPKAERLH